MIPPGLLYALTLLPLLAPMRAPGAVAFGANNEQVQAAPASCLKLRKHGDEARARSCFESLLRSDQGVPGGAAAYLRAEGSWGLEHYQEANAEFRSAVTLAPANTLYRVRWGRLLHERFNNKDAAGLFAEALARDPRTPQAYLGLALVSADGYDDRAFEWVNKALAADPRLVEAHELKASLALEDSDTEQAAREADAALALADDALDALAVHASIEVLADRAPEAWLARIAHVNPHYGRGAALVAHHLVLNLRYEDGIAYYRKALEAEPRLWAARSELGLNLMRLGRDAEARAELVRCYEAGYRNEATVNSLRLLDSYANFARLADDTTVLRLHKKEADLLYPYFHAELERDIADYERKYHRKLPGPVQVEVYPDHEDFAVRTLGMPGLGALGVTFGSVVAMDSPSARKPGEFHWASTLRHEMSHVFILTATHHRVPRWFTEGLAVHEETQSSPEWGDPLTPDIVVALRDKKLLPVAELDRGFVRPQYPAQVIVSYYQAGRICDYIQSRWGADKLLEMVQSFAERLSTPRTISERLGMRTEEFDAAFQSWLYADLPPAVAHFEEWRQRLARLAAQAEQQQLDAVIKEGGAVIGLYPQYVYDGNAYELLAAAHAAKGDQSDAIHVLEQYARAGGRSPRILEDLARMQEHQGERAAAAATLERINYIDPGYDETLHRKLGQLWLAEKNYPGAIREFSAVLALRPLDRVSAEFDLAQAYFASGAREQALDAVLAALETAPGYRPAQKLLLQIKGQ